MSDNGTQFSDKKFGKFLSGLGIKQKFSSVEHTQCNGQAEAANKVILSGTTPQSSTGETPFQLTDSVDTMIPMEIRELSSMLLLNRSDKVTKKDLIDETKEMVHLSEAALKQS
ncbi:uncharacterized protein LOC130934791 [Arachis stenosperma]|uniref:uncharacterized protein LOC130934791 n=1 Tax=Arachis stenosperma TaxID=217475 RepID=UPI0025AC79B9|nr:uncharacterized protein LOC130934791 [Arachis stenosperma]